MNPASAGGSSPLPGDPPAEATPPPGRPGASPVLLLTLLALGAGNFSVLQSLVNPALGTMGAELGADPSTSSWVLTGYLLAAAVATPLAGRLGDLYGRRNLLLGVLFLLAVGGVVAASAPTMGVLIAGRLVQGAAGALYPLSFGIVRDQLPPERVASGIGLLSGTLGVGGGIGIVAAGPVVEVLGWRWLFWIPALLTLVVLVGAWYWLPDSSSRAPGGISPLPPVLLTGWLTALLLGLSKAGVWGWTSARVLSLLAGAVVLAAAWLVSESRSPHPLVDLRVLRRRAVWATDLAALAIGFALFGSFLLIPQLLTVPRSGGYGFGASVTVAGLFLLPSALMSLIFGPVSGRLSTRYGTRGLITGGALVVAASMALPALDHSGYWQLLVCSTGLGIGMGLAFAALANAVVEHVPPSQIGVATGVNTLARSLGGSLGTALVATSLVSDSGFTRGFWICALAGLVSAVTGLCIPRGRGPARCEAPDPASSAPQPPRPPRPASGLTTPASPRPR
ncbi:MFS transporter [Kineosporia succinea]|uniref:EmrB/QacA subfamily drug resistance transporter n=1 Tax=Kineosporia succinea TaxID=84632 RepID=A0ABT9PCC5_9ACTN|nr:MFS transporter [Kineosporia succinea]MDP9830364.1 EmrB/QacA subfamily drug resistance transporter [Kineosporia succinea]